VKFAATTKPGAAGAVSGPLDAAGVIAANAAAIAAGALLSCYAVLCGITLRVDYVPSFSFSDTKLAVAPLLFEHCSFVLRFGLCLDNK
jgi:hypothetical protein